MRDPATRTLAGTVLALALTAGAAAAQQGAITVTGRGEVAAAPDMATVTFAVAAEAASAEAALAQSSERVAAVLDALEQAGVAARDIQTTGLALAPRRRDDAGAAPAIQGYTARNGVTVEVRDLDALGGLLDAGVAAGANRLGGVSFGLADRAAVAAEARRAAVRDARTKARDYAEAAGVALGPLTALEAAGAGGPAPMARATVAESVPVAAGEITVAARVRLVYAVAAGGAD